MSRAELVGAQRVRPRRERERGRLVHLHRIVRRQERRRRRREDEQGQKAQAGTSDEAHESAATPSRSGSAGSSTA